MVGVLERLLHGLAGPQVAELVRNQNMQDRNISLDVAVTGALDAIIIINSDGNIISFNPAAETIFGFDRDAVIGKNMGSRSEHLQEHLARGLLGQRSDERVAAEKREQRRAVRIEHGPEQSILPHLSLIHI